jgi:hypothetical protein
MMRDKIRILVDLRTQIFQTNFLPHLGKLKFLSKNRILYNSLIFKYLHF